MGRHPESRVGPRPRRVSLGVALGSSSTGNISRIAAPAAGDDVGVRAVFALDPLRACKLREAGGRLDARWGRAARGLNRQQATAARSHGAKT
jgi:hypothetical protein